MRIQNGFFMAIALALAAVTAVGTIYTDPYQQASQSQSAGFDALAHDLFDDLVGPGQHQNRVK
jgi:hypothetical protein